MSPRVVENAVKEWDRAGRPMETGFYAASMSTDPKMHAWKVRADFPETLADAILVVASEEFGIRILN